MRGTPEERFWAKVKKTRNCWLWQGATTRNGYGHLNIAGKYVRAHRLAYELLIGKIPRGLFILHECDTPACVRPTHLFANTQAVNMADMRNKQRGARGIKTGTAKLTPTKVRKIRTRYANGNYTHSSLSKQFKVSRRTIGRVISKELWAHV